MDIHDFMTSGPGAEAPAREAVELLDPDTPDVHPSVSPTNEARRAAREAALRGYTTWGVAVRSWQQQDIEAFGAYILAEVWPLAFAAGHAEGGRVVASIVREALALGIGHQPADVQMGYATGVNRALSALRAWERTSGEAAPDKAPPA